MGMAVVHGEKTFYLQIQLLRNCCKSQFTELLENLPIVETCAHHRAQVTQGSADHCCQLDRGLHGG